MYKMSTKKAAESHGVPRSTLQRYLKQCHEDGSVEKKTMGRRCVLSTEQEEELSSILTEMESRLYGLTTEDAYHHDCSQTTIYTRNISQSQSTAINRSALRLSS